MLDSQDHFTAKYPTSWCGCLWLTVCADSKWVRWNSFSNTHQLTTRSASLHQLVVRFVNKQLHSLYVVKYHHDKLITWHQSRWLGKVHVRRVTAARQWVKNEINNVSTMFTTVNKTIGDPGKREDLKCLKLQLNRFAGLNLIWVYRYIRVKRFHVPDLCRN